MRLRSIELNVIDQAGASSFLTTPWGLEPAPVPGTQSAYFRGSGEFPYLVALHTGAAPSVASITFTCTAAELDALAGRAAASGAPMERVRASDPGGGEGWLISGPEGEVFRFLSGDTSAPAIQGAELPVKLTHVVINSRDAELCGDFAEQVLGFKVSDRTRGMVFVRCNTSHHSIAFARAGFSSLNHIAFEMQDLDGVMRGIGRLRDAGFAPAWGPGRHGPGHNVFAYFISPFGPVVEFSTAVEIVDDDYPTGAPDDWTWPVNRIDHWGLSDKDVAALGVAERRFTFAPLAAKPTESAKRLGDVR